MNLKYLGILTLFGYLCVALLQGLYLMGRRIPDSYVASSRLRYYTLSLASLCGHGWILYKLIETPQGQNLDNLIMFSLTFWLMNIFVFLSSLRTKAQNLCVLTYPLAALSILLVLCFPGMAVMDTKTQPTVLAHIFISLFAISLLMLAGLQATLLLLQHYLLKKHSKAPLLNILPPLQAMETMLFQIIWSGMLLFCASLVSGFFRPTGLFYPMLLPKTVLAVFSFILLAWLLIGRYFFGWRGPTAVRWTVSGTLLAFLSYFGTKALMI